jgi:hypothetical protein
MHIFDCCNSNSDDDTTTTNPRKKEKTMNVLDAELVREMNELSVEEREKALDEIHGVNKTPEETPESVVAALEAFDKALLGMHKKHRRALDRAFFLRPSLKTDVKFKLWFLRTEYFDANKAATRMARYYASKLIIFGKENLAKDVTLANLDQREIEKSFRVGCHTVLPNKDSSGRLVIVSDTRYWDYNDNLTMVRAVEELDIYCFCCQFFTLLSCRGVSSSNVLVSNPTTIQPYCTNHNVHSSKECGVFS